MEKKDFMEQQERLACIAKAMGHPIRIAMLKFLCAQKECYFGDIHKELTIAKSTASQHLTELKNAGLITGEIVPPKVRYCINHEGWQEAMSLFRDLFMSCPCGDKPCDCNNKKEE